MTGEQVALYWYAMNTRFKFNCEPRFMHAQANQFTQMVWCDSRKFGIGKARTRTGKVIVVANYRPGGNVPGKFEENVLPKVGSGEIVDVDCVNLAD